MIAESLLVRVATATLECELEMPEGARSVVVLAHGSGSERSGPGNRLMSESLTDRGIGSLFIDLLTPYEASIDERTRHLRFDIELLAERLSRAVDWCRMNLGPVRVALVGSGTGGAAALECAARRPRDVAAVVSRGGRTDLVSEKVLKKLVCPVLLIVAGGDASALAANRTTAAVLGAQCDLDAYPAANGAFGKTYDSEESARTAVGWLAAKLAAGNG